MIKIPSIGEFYSNKAPGPNGLTFTEVLSQSDEKLESVHNEIQWMFPLNEGSAFNPNAPIITNWDLPILQHYTSQTMMFAAVVRFMDFYGFKLNGSGNPRFIQGEFFNQKSHWLRPGDHNLKRITRIIRSTRFFNMFWLGMAVFESMVEVAKEYPTAITGEVIGYWTNALCVPLDVPINDRINNKQSCTDKTIKEILIGVGVQRDSALDLEK